MDETPPAEPTPRPRPWLLREAARPGEPHAEIVRSTPVGQPVRVHSQEHRWFRPVRYD